MKGDIVINPEGQALRIDLECGSIEDVDQALEAIKHSARAVFPTIVFAGEPGVDGDEKPAKRRRARSSATGEPPEGSFDAQVLFAARKLGPDRIAIADVLDARTGVVAMSLKRLKDRGCLK